MINTEWESRRRQLKEALQFGLLVPLYIFAWIICIIAAIVLEMTWKFEEKRRNQNKSYDVDKVVKKLEKETSGFTTWAEDAAYKMGIEKAIEIIRAGGDK